MDTAKTAVLVLLTGLLCAGCGSTEEVAPPSPQAPAPSPTKQEEAPPIRFETKTDTVNTVGNVEHPEPTADAREAQIRFMVQVGAYKDPQNASTVQVTARDRYHLPVLNDYHATLGLYQIRIGFFESREAAQQFLEKMQHDFPTDYKDSWIVQLKR